MRADLVEVPQLDFSAGSVAFALALVAVFAVKHVVADFVLQTNWIARGKERVDGWTLPLLAHVGLHGAFTLALMLAVKPAMWWLALADLGIHAVIDRGKSLVSHWGGWTPGNEKFWWLLGLDQGLHQLTNVGLVAAVTLR